MRFLGIDVAKAKLDCCLLLDPTSTKQKTKKFENNPKGFAAMLAWIDRYEVPRGALHAIMEGTGVYHELLALALTDGGVRVSIVNPAHIKNFAKGIGIQTKTDKSDSFVLARYGVLTNPSFWTPPSKQARELKSLLARQEALAQDLQREKNRQEKVLSTQTPRQVEQSIEQSIAFLQQQIKQLQQEVDDHIDQNPELREDRDLLVTIPGVGKQVGNNMLALMHCHDFATAEQCAAYLGLVPVEHQSGSSVHARPRLSKAGPARIRALLYMPAMVAVKYNPHVQALYDRLVAKGKNKKAALGAAMRKLVHLCFGVFKTKMPYQIDYMSQCTVLR